MCVPVYVCVCKIYISYIYTYTYERERDCQTDMYHSLLKTCTPNDFLLAPTSRRLHRTSQYGNLEDKPSVKLGLWGDTDQLPVTVTWKSAQFLLLNTRGLGVMWKTEKGGHDGEANKIIHKKLHWEKYTCNHNCMFMLNCVRLGEGTFAFKMLKV